MKLLARALGTVAVAGVVVAAGTVPANATGTPGTNSLAAVLASDGDTFEVIGSISAVHAAGEHDAFLDYLRRPEVALITITVTEQGYLADPDRQLRRTAEVEADIGSLHADPTAPVRSLPARLVAGLQARRQADAGPITILSCASPWISPRT